MAREIARRRLNGLAAMFFLAAAASGCSRISSTEQEPPTRPNRRRPAQFKETDTLRLFRMKSELLSQFWGREMYLEAGVALPPNRAPDEKPPLCFFIHGFGGSHRAAWSQGRKILEKLEAPDSDYPRMIYVYPNAQFSLGHHEFADSVNNGPWGEAFIREMVPAIEREFGADGRPEGRFLTGHSSGGWSSLWLQTAYPDFFGGVWSSAPDPVDFRDFTGVDIYKFDNAYYDPKGREIMLMRRGKEWTRSLEQFTAAELERSDYGGQQASFDAVFSPRGEDGRPMPMFNRETGAIDKAVAEAWKKYDISLLLRENWKVLGPKLRGKIRVFCGTLDTYRLDGAVRILEKELGKLGSDAQFIWAPERSHSLSGPHAELWPNGLDDRMHREMWAEFQKR